MARARNIKPAFFTSEQIADQCPLGRLLFIGLWTLADFKGDIEWKERTIKVQVLPFDECSVKELAINLDKSGLIRFYSDGEKIYLNIPNFEKHQNPHKNERDKGSELPAFTEAMRQRVDLQGLTINRDVSGVVPFEDGTDPADSLLLIPDSPSLKPDNPNPESRRASAPALVRMFSEFWSQWPVGFGDKGSRKNAEAAFLKIRPDKDLFTTMCRAVQAQFLDKQMRERTGQFCPNFKHVERWLKNREWENDIEPQRPVRQSRADSIEQTLDEVFGTAQSGILEGDFQRVDCNALDDPS